MHAAAAQSPVNGTQSSSVPLSTAPRRKVSIFASSCRRFFSRHPGFSVDSGLKTAGMTTRVVDTLLCCPVLRACLGTVRLCDISGGDKPLPYENHRGGGRSGGVNPRLSLPSNGNMDFPNKLLEAISKFRTLALRYRRANPARRPFVIRYLSRNSSLFLAGCIATRTRGLFRSA
jgi:hypothetical protein